MGASAAQVKVIGRATGAAPTGSGHDGGMAGPSPALAAALEPVVAALRRFLLDLNDDEVPVPLRTVAKATGRRLPPPLLRRLLVELDRNEWLRQKAADEVDATAHPEAAAFLAREPGWWIELADRTMAKAQPAPTAKAAKHLAAMTRLEDSLAEAKRRIQELRTRNQTLETEVKTLQAEVRHRRTDTDAGGLAARVHLVETQLEEERRQRLEADARVSEVLRRRTARQKRTEAGAGPRRGGLDDPVAVGRQLDLDAAALAAAVRGGPVAAKGAEPVSAEDAGAEPVSAEDDLHLPPGVLPDTAEAITWLLGLGTQVTLIVDGYNAGFLLGSKHSVPEARRRVLDQLDRFDRLAATPHRIVAVFDSGQKVALAPAIDPGGIEVRFASQAASADDAIVDLVAALTSPAIVITNDRELRERVEANRALALWATAFAEWVRAS